MSKIRNIIFDLDGTLADSSDGVVESVNYSLERLGQPPQPAERIKRFIGFPLSKMYPHFTDVSPDKLRDQFQVRAAEVMVDMTVMMPGAEELLTELQQQGYRMAIATTKIRRHLDGIVRKFGWDTVLTAWTAGDEVPMVKPDPAILRLTLKRMKAKPEETLVVGDTINDVFAAKAVPMKVAGVSSPYGGRTELCDAKPDYLLSSIEVLPVLLDSLAMKRF